MGKEALPNYLETATPNPVTNRAPWNKNTAPTYAGIFLWFVFWMGATQAPNAGGVLSHGVMVPIISLVLAALLCHTFYYVILGLMGQRTGHPLYIVGTSTFGAKGGFLMPGFLMGLLQFGWLGVNIYFASMALSQMIPIKAEIIMVVWGVLAAFMGLKGIQYVARVATYLPLIPLVTLLVLFFMTLNGLKTFNPEEFVQLHQNTVAETPAAFSSFGIVAFVITYVIGFFATAGAAGVDFGTNSRDDRDVHMGGLVGIAVATVFTAGLAVLIVAGAYGNADIAAKATAAAKAEGGTFAMDAFAMINLVLGESMGKWVLFLLAVSAFPAACFSSFIAANSFKTTLSKVNPFVSVGIGTAVSIILAITGKAGQLIPVFSIIGASFGPICGAMAVDYVLSGCKWAGPRAGYNPAGWLAWGFGFSIGIIPNLGIPLPMAPLWAMISGAIIYFLMAKAGLVSETLKMPQPSAAE
jgi:cytosine permease